MHPVERMRSLVHAFLNRTSCVYVEPVKRTTYVAFRHKGRVFLAPTVFLFASYRHICQERIPRRREDRVPLPHLYPSMSPSLPGLL